MSDNKPCETPCPKCGSADVARKFIGYGDMVSGTEYGRPPHKYVTGLAYSFTAVRDIIRHTCKVCEYVWADVTLKKVKQRPGGK